MCVQLIVLLPDLGLDKICVIDPNRPTQQARRQAGGSIRVVRVIRVEEDGYGQVISVGLGWVKSTHRNP